MSESQGSETRSDEMREWMEQAIKYLNADGKGESDRFFLLSAVRAVLCHKSPENDLELWFQTRFRRHPTKDRSLRPKRAAEKPMNRKTRRRHEYKAIQSLWTKNMSKAASKILDGDSNTQCHPTLEEQLFVNLCQSRLKKSPLSSSQ